MKRFLPLARHLARQHASPEHAFDDVFQVACIALVKAVDRFDPDRGVTFSSYATPTIAGEIKRYFRDTGWAVRVPRGEQELALAIQPAIGRLTQQLGRPPSVGEVAERLGRPDEEIVGALRAISAYRAASLDAPCADDMSLGDVLGAGDDRIALVAERLDLSALLRCLTRREREALWLRFIHELPQSEIAELLGVSQVEVSRRSRSSHTGLCRAIAVAHSPVAARRRRMSRRGDHRTRRRASSAAGTTVHSRAATAADGATAARARAALPGMGLPGTAVASWVRLEGRGAATPGEDGRLTAERRRRHGPRRRACARPHRGAHRTSARAGRAGA